MPTLEEQRRALAEQALGVWGGQPLPQTLEQAQQNAAMFEPRALSGPEVSLLEQATQAPAAAFSAPAVDPTFTMQPGNEPVMQVDQAPPVSLARPPDRPAPAPRVIEVPPQDVTGTAPPPETRLAVAGGARRPTLLGEQSAIAAESRDRAEQAKRDAEISTDVQAGLTEMKGEQEAATYGQMAEHSRGAQADLEEIGRLSEQRRAAKTAAAEKVGAQVKDANDKAASIQIRDSRSTGQRVMGALAIALGAAGDQANLAAGLNIGMNVQTHHADRALSMVNDAIQRDLDIQRDNLKNARDSAAAKQSEYGIAVEAVRDEDAQRLLAEGALKEKYALGFDAIKNQGMSEAATTTAAITAEQLRREAAQLKAQGAELEAARDEERVFQLQVQADRERKAAAAAKAAAGKKNPLLGDLLQKEADGTITVPEKDALLSLRKKQGDIDKGARAGAADQGIDLPGYKATNKLAAGDQTKAFDVHKAAESLKEDYRRLAEIRAANNGGTILNRNDVREAEGIINGMGPKYSQLYGSGAPSKDEFAKFTETLINPTDFQVPYGFDPAESYRRGMSHIDRVTRSQLKTYGYQPEGAEDVRTE